jgi:hypothetical protein
VDAPDAPARHLRLRDQRPPVEPNIGAVVDRLVGELFGALANNLAPLRLPMTKEQLEAKAENENRVYERLTRGGAARAARANCTNTTSALACSTFTLEGVFSYCPSSSRSSSSTRAPKINPSNFPVFVKSAGALEALRNTTARVAVILRLPDAPVKRPVPPLI